MSDAAFLFCAVTPPVVAVIINLLMFGGMRLSDLITISKVALCLSCIIHIICASFGVAMWAEFMFYVVLITFVNLCFIFLYEMVRGVYDGCTKGQ